MSEDERRQYPRVSVQLPVHLHIGGRTYPMETLNLSKSGLFVIARLRKIPCEVEQDARIDLLTEGGDVGLSATVVRVEQGREDGDFLSGVALSIQAADGEASDALKEIVESASPT